MILPERVVLLQTSRVLDLHHLPRFFHGAIPGQLALRLGPGLFGTMPTRQGVARLDVAGDLGGDTQADAAAPHLGK